MQVVIPSRKRVDVCRRAVRLFHDPIVSVAESEVDDYSVLPCRVVPRPDDLGTLGAIRQWILDNFDDEILVMVDDDTTKAYCLVGSRKRTITNPDSIMQILENAAEVAEGIGTPMFGFNQAWDVRKYNPHDPFHFNGWFGSVLGFVGREAHYDPRVTLHDDIDVILSILLRQRIVFIDHRFSFVVGTRFKASGGNAVNRSQQAEDLERACLKQKWGKWLSVWYVKTAVRYILNVKRRQM